MESSPSDTAKSVVPYTHGLTGVDIPLDDRLTYIFWISVCILCLILLVGRVWQMANAHLRHLFNLHSKPEEQTYWSEEKTSLWPVLKRHLLYAPFYKKRHNKEIQLSSALNIGTLPSRLHSAILIFYLTSNVVYCAYLDYHRPKAALLAELRGRTGHLAVVNMVPLIILAGRNNPLIYLLRVSFDTYNLFHRWIGRVVVLEAVTHTLAWASNVIAASGSKAPAEHLRESQFLQYGMLGTVAFGLILITSPSVVRHAFYETFLHVHQVLALAAIVGVWVHCDLGKLPGSAYVRWALAMWIVERCVRLFRLIYRNVSRKGLTRVTIEALPSSEAGTEACRVSFELARPWKYKPGTHAYIYLPGISFWMNHPFSIAWSDTRPTPYLALENEKLPSSNSDLDLPKPNRTKTTIYMIIAKRTGMTRALYERAKAAPSRIVSVTGFVEGPYGGLDSLQSYGTVILFAAGVGITHQIGHVRDLLNQRAAGTTATRKIILVWSVKTTDTLEWVRPWMDEILGMPNRKQMLRLEIFVTRPRSAREVVSRSETVLMYPGRCNPDVILAREMERRIGAVGVTVCGPGAFADDVRAAVRRVGIGGGDVEGGGGGGGGSGSGGVCDFVEESFTW